MEQLVSKAKVKALKNNEMKVYDELEQKKMTKADMKIYLYGDRNAQKESVDLNDINKDWGGQDLKNPAYGDFWKDGEKQRSVRGSQSVKRSRQGSRGSQGENPMATPERKRRAIRELYLPEITKNTWVKRKEVDLSTLYEDPFFDLVKKKPKRTFRTGKASMDARV